MIGIIGAMPIEVEGLKAKMQNPSVQKFAGLEFCQGLLSGVECVVAHCNPGKVNAALCTQLMINHYQPRLIINSGIAGGIGKDIHIGDLVISSAVVQHDMDTSPLGDRKGYLSGIGLIEIPAAEHLVTLLSRTAPEVYKGSVHVGIIATGDQFICNGEKLQELHRNFGALACEMEGAAIGHVCHVNGLDFVVLRTISDNADDDAKMDYATFAPIAAQRGIELLCRVLPKLN
ncbi:5'-methylthioadenosine/adenosylhomocysteine nucleosidase [Clostridium minihomine]|uniref:5'-methylthioadenosine/adenosylhomocysteine nucleosidase n=1 Tax=Clostridium minihomine TaxID=2045012 RepID=UPI000C75F2BD|nr:5'-methylthioadenosine/adenosylhomocysteine nucleosidase [Clostridium minihomine]